MADIAYYFGLPSGVLYAVALSAVLLALYVGGGLILNDVVDAVLLRVRDYLAREVADGQDSGEQSQDGKWNK